MTVAIQTVKTAEEVRALGRGRVFKIRLTKAMTWREVHAVIYYTANREVRLTMRDGTKIVGTLAETPGYFKHDNRVWLRVAGRKTRLGIKPEKIAWWSGFRAPTLAEAYTAFIHLTASNTDPENLAEARSIARDM